MSDDSRKRLNYDEIAARFNQRYAISPPGRRIHALLKLVEDSHARCVLEVGCGTGYWLEVLSGSGAEIYGLDYSLGMLRQAKYRRTLMHLTRGNATQLPYRTCSFDLLYCVDALHHFQRPAEFIREAWRILRPGGVLALSGSDPHQEQEIWYVYDYFAGTREYDLQRFPSRETTMAWIGESGFQDIRIEVLERIENNYIGNQVWEDPYLNKTACSQLALLDGYAYQVGLNRIREAIEHAEKRNKDIAFRLVLPIHLITARKPTQVG